VVRGLHGDMVVTSVMRHAGENRVFNMTVEADHDYYVGALAALTHNNCGRPYSSLEPSDPLPEHMQAARELTNPSENSTDLGNRVHYDQLNGATGEELPTKLSYDFKNTDFAFKPRGAAGPDVEVLRGTHPSEYPGSSWEPGNNSGDFKPDTASGWNRFNNEISSGKLPDNTQILPYDAETGAPAWKRPDISDTTQGD
jgi:hypothetical protein